MDALRSWLDAPFTSEPRDVLNILREAAAGVEEERLRMVLAAACERLGNGDYPHEELREIRALLSTAD